MNAAAEQTAQLTVTERPITSFVYLQILDLMTTLAFLANGAMEGNPFVRFLMQNTAHPVLGLLVAKCIAVTLGMMAWRTGRLRSLRKANVFFALLVVWNLIVTIISAVD
jgi:hypothetical protein